MVVQIAANDAWVINDSIFLNTLWFIFLFENSNMTFCKHDIILPNVTPVYFIVFLQQFMVIWNSGLKEKVIPNDIKATRTARITCLLTKVWHISQFLL